MLVFIEGAHACIEDVEVGLIGHGMRGFAAEAPKLVHHGVVQAGHATVPVAVVIAELLQVEGHGVGGAVDVVGAVLERSFAVRVVSSRQ